MAPIISVRGLGRSFTAGDETVTVLRDVDLDIEAGEMVAIVGQSGSGKSTLMNILGCLDQPTVGSYAFSGRDIGTLEPDELAALRREHFGFIFQRYQLLSDLNAMENVEVPAIYAGATSDARRERAIDLLDRLGLSDRLGNRPSQLSGGQQQRVSVARALMNGGEVILADEPTGALDSKSGKELIALLVELNRDGHTIIIVTHDPAIAAQARRIIEISDGAIVSDTKKSDQPAHAATATVALARQNGFSVQWSRLGEAFFMALRAMSSHRLRTFLTMLGIIIGIASVVGVVALGQGSQATVLERISAIGTNTVTIAPGSGFGDRTAARIETLTGADADALAAEPFADSVTPTVSSNATVIYRNVSATAQISGVGAAYFQVNGRTMTEGVTFDASDVASLSQVAVIDETAAAKLFTDGTDAVGQIIMLGDVPVRIVGVAATTTSFGPSSTSLSVWIPYTTLMTRISGQDYLSGITVRVADSYDIDQAQTEITDILTQRHRAQDFYVQNSNTIRETITSTSQTLTLLIAAIAIISLIVGGIGVMNIMLVSVSERTKEIGVRMAVGARRADIMRQFLIEAVLVCLIGGTAGVALAFGAGTLLTTLAGTRLSYSAETVVLAFLSSSLIGVLFGFMPARSASRMNPVDALARD
ncbi:MAG: MacB family efflux pump subunit [Devosia sp.]|nr:MacB family efflux pump subunit [Devosia sp.]